MTNIFIISAPSGSGKSTLVNRLLAEVRSLLFSVSYTTRPPRGKEINGKSYHFISPDEFQAMRDRDEFLESAGVFGKCYGTHRRFYDQAAVEGKDLVLDIDVQGARQLKGKFPEAVTVFILPPSREELEKRLRARGEDAEDVIQRRLRDAAEEIRNYNAYDYTIINRDKDDAAEVLCSIVRGERVRRSRMEVEIRPILETFLTVKR